MEASEMKDLICKVLDENFAQDITILDVEHLTVMTEYFVICTAKSVKQVSSIAEILKDKLEEQGIDCSHNDITSGGKWACLDIGEVIVHIFNDETRMFYCLEKLWSDGKNVTKYKSEK